MQVMLCDRNDRRICLLICLNGNCFTHHSENKTSAISKHRARTNNKIYQQNPHIAKKTEQKHHKFVLLICCLVSFNCLVIKPRQFRCTGEHRSAEIPDVFLPHPCRCLIPLPAKDCKSTPHQSINIFAHLNSLSLPMFSSNCWPASSSRSFRSHAQAASRMKKAAAAKPTHATKLDAQSWQQKKPSNETER